MVVTRAGIHEMHVLVANREDPDQTASLLLQKQSDLGLHCLSRPFCSQLVFELLEHEF